MSLSVEVVSLRLLVLNQVSLGMGLRDYLLCNGCMSSFY